MNTRTVAAIACVSAAALSLAACGADSSKTSGSGAGASGAASGASNTVASNMILGGPPEFQTRKDGLPGLTSTYGVSFGKFTATDAGGPVTVNALKNGQIDAADLFTTDPSIKANGFVVLTDPKNNFSAQNVVPIMTKSKVTDGVKTVVNGVSAKLTTDGLTALISKVSNDKQDPDAVAKQWLADNGLSATSTSAAGVTLKAGSANFTESEILMDIYADALTNAGATVTKQPNIGSREKYYPALQQGSLDLFPEYTGVLLDYIDKNATATSPDEVYAGLQKALPSTLTALDKSAAEDKDAIVVTKATADKYHLTSIADLAKSAS